MDGDQTQSENITPEDPNKLTKPIEVKAKISIVNIVLIILLVVLVGVSGFLFYKNSQLKKQIANMQKIVLPTPVATSPKADWKTFTDPNGAYTFEYPSDYTISTDEGLINDPTMKFAFTVGAFKSDLDVSKWITQNRCPTDNVCSNFINGALNGSTQFEITAHFGSIETVTKHGNTIYELSMNARDENKTVTQTPKDTFSKIVSTFKFIDPEPTTSSDNVACTLEAKQCPDGSYVARSGPKCEFTPCP